MILPLIGIIIFIAALLFIGMYFRMLKPMIAMIGCILIVIGIVGYFKYQGFQDFMAMKEGMAHAKQTISTTTAAGSDWKIDLEAVGSLRAAKGVDISNELTGIVEEINFNSGGDVEAGTLLLKQRAEDDIAKLASLEATAKLAEIVVNRDRKQLGVQAISQATLDADNATLQSARAQVAEQKATVDKKFIRAPFSGHLGIRNVDVGQYLNAGTAIVTLQQLDPIYLDFNLPQQALAQIKTGQKITVKNDTFPGRTFEGTIAAINPKVDTTTRNVAIRAELANPDHALLPGMYATTDISVGEAQHFVTLPQTAITYNPYGNTVYILRHEDEVKKEEAADDKAKEEVSKGETLKEKDAQAKPVAEKTYKPVSDKDTDLVAEQTFVTVGETRGDQVQILKGVKEGDVVVSSGQLKLTNGAAVTINNAVEPKDDADPKPMEQ